MSWYFYLESFRWAGDIDYYHVSARMAGPATKNLHLMGADRIVTFAILMIQGVLDGWSETPT